MTNQPVNPPSSFIPTAIQPYLNGAGAIAMAPVKATYQVGGSILGTLGTVCLTMPLGALASRASSIAKSVAISTAKKQGYKAISDLCDYIQKETSADTASNPATGLSALFKTNKELKELLSSYFATEAAIDAKATELTDKLQAANMFIHGMSLGTPSSDTLTAPTLEQLRQTRLDIIEAPVQATEPVNHPQETRNESLKKELKTFTTSLRRTLEMQFILSQIPRGSSKEEFNIPDQLKNVMGESEHDFHKTFKSVMKDLLDKSTTPAFLRPIYYAYLLCLHFLLQVLTCHIFNTINRFLDKKITDFTKSEKAQIMELITNILCEGFHLYTCEIINICHSLNNSANTDGTPDMMFEDRLREKATLHKNMSQKDFYLYALDRILKHCFNLSITRYVLKKLIQFSGFLNNPFLSLPQAIKTNTGYFHAIDKAVVKFITPIIQNMKIKSPAAPAAREASVQTDSHDETQTFTTYNKESLKKAIASLFEASDVHQASNLSEIKQIANRSKKSDQEKTLLENAGLSPDAILKQTAEAGAVALLQNISEIIDQSFLEDQAINALKALNEVFKTNAEISKPDYQTAERERKEVLNNFTQVIITKALEAAPILNTKAIVSKLNNKIAEAKHTAECIFATLEWYMTTQESTSRYPDALIENVFKDIQALEQKLNHAANTIGFSEDQKQALMAPYAEIKKYVQQFQNAYQPRKGKTARDTLADFRKAIDSKVFAPYEDTSILNNDTVQKAAKSVVNIMLKPKFNQAYEFICDFKTIKYCLIHQGVLARV